jgi:hypothetical protein
MSGTKPPTSPALGYSVFNLVLVCVLRDRYAVRWTSGCVDDSGGVRWTVVDF